jgi:DNA-binding CsgD family transcriptional regulator
MPAESEALRLIPLIYDAAEDPALWPNAIREIALALDSVSEVFTIDNLRRGQSNMTIALGIDPAFHRLYNERYESINLHLRRARPLMAAGQVLASQQLCGEQELMATEYYQDFLRPQQDRWFHILGGCVAKEQGLLSVLSFMRGRRAGPFTDEERHLLETLMPHLLRATRLHQKLALHSDVVESLDRIPTGVLLVDRRSQIHFANQAGREILNGNDGVGIDRTGVLTTSNRRVPELVGRAGQVASGCETVTDESVQVLRPSGKRAYILTAVPIRQCQPFSQEKRAGAAVFVTDPERRQPIAELLIRLYDLTAAEARLVTLLVDGKDVGQICEEMSIARNTARTHLSHIRGKMGLKRQAEIVSVVLKSVDAIRL